ncbi:MAG: Wzz/FepE/Etk N-terminal domain-containing protein [Deltaproteobacteria bacterium]|nr:Wzz/FepE/Etk N-terminal domain-containing protein [Deltaproteobacteria bacterium]
MLHENMELVDYLDLLRRRKWIIIFSFLFILFGASFYSVVTPEMFRSSTTILVVPQRVPENYVRSTATVRIEDRLATIQQQVLSRTRLLAIIDELGLYKEEREKNIDALVERTRKCITIEVTQKEAFTLSFVHNNRQMAMLTASRLASFFIDENLKSREQQAVGTADFLDSQLQETKKKLEEQEEQVRRYKSAFADELPQQLQANLQIMSRLQEQLRMNSDAIRVAQDRRMFIESQINTMESQIGAMEAQASVTAERARASSSNKEPIFEERISPSDPAAPYLPGLNSKNAQLANLSTKYTDQYPEIRRLKKEISQLERRVVEARRNAPSVPPPTRADGTSNLSTMLSGAVPMVPFSRDREEIRRQRTVLEGINQEIQSSKKEQVVIRKRLADVEEMVKRSPKREQEMIRLTRDYDNLKRSYDDLLRKKLDADVAQNLEKRQKGEQFQILDPANLPDKPFVPNRPKVFGVAVLAAFLVGFGGAIGLEMFDPAARGVKDFRRFSGLLVLASIPSIHDKVYDKKVGRRRAAVFGSLITFTLVVTVFLLVYGEKVRNILQGAR